MTEFDPRELRDAFGAFMTGVTVVTTHDVDKKPIGFTANSFSSVSLDPPLVSICIANSSSNYDALATASGFAVNVLSETQKDVSNTFARPVDDRFAAVTWQNGPNGAPVFEDCSAWFDCSMFKTVEAGDHLILIGKVEAFENSTRPGLGYVRGAYVTPALEAEALSNTSNLLLSVLIEYRGKVLLVDDGRGQLSLPEMHVGKEGVSAVLQGLITSNGAEAEAGFIYSVYEDEARATQHISFLCQASRGTATIGAFVELSSTTLADIADPAVRIMLERFASESRMGNFGVYFGNHVSGNVRAMTSGS
ncbi:p-hydroxyphenylacetate 3-hydroxylase, reductase component [Shimia sp. SK013]|uniref:flavin reductase family protein n=1 Tax=Shimia sp. SK013 TaxID=1389006 RepID=UPI0006B5416E|nr:flavin reductase family protein [Shimia sp. SK013]KPA21159.1 p-hydroxyphenylacetate 3-hydroxylase, reductase component [Shimia sp. SK013]